jgi:hypothetical protein
MKVIYVAGPFRGPTAWDIAENIRDAERIGLLVARAGAMPLIPHANTAHFHGQRDDQFFLDGTLELLRRCDAAVFIPGWHGSMGSLGEYAECLRLGKPTLSLSLVPHGLMSETIFRFLAGLEATANVEEDNSEEQRAASSPADH